MRKYFVLAIVALVAMLVPSFASAQDGGVQSLVVKVTPTKQDKKKFKPAQIFVDVITKNNDQAGANPDQPPSADRTRVDFSSNLKFNTSAAPGCKVNEAALENTDTEQATELCGKESIVSVGGGKAGSNQTGATVLIDPAPAVPGNTPIQIDVEVTAFNGNQKDTIFLFARADDVNNTSVLVGKLSKGSAAGFGNTLDVTIPDLLAGAISDFKTTVKSGRYVTARCKDKTPTYQVRTEYENHAPTTATAQDKCKQKRRRR